MAFSLGADRPNGLVPLRHLTGGTIRASEYTIASGYATSIFSGDPVVTVGTGKTIAQAAAGGNLLGVFAGVRYTDASGDTQFSPYWPASTTATNIVAYVFDDPDIVYEVQADAAVAAAGLGLCYDIVVGTGSTVTGRSAVELDVGATAANAQLRTIGFVDRIDAATASAYPKLEVVIGEHEYGVGRNAGV